MRAFIFIFSLGPVWLYWDLRPSDPIGALEVFLHVCYFMTVYGVVHLHGTLTSIRNALEDYRENDFSLQEGWTGAKERALRDGALKGHDLERLAETLDHSEASVRTKLVKLKIYDAYLEQLVDCGARKFAEWKKLQRKIGKTVALEDFGPREVENDADFEGKKPDSRLIRSLAENWFDPKIEFCESFHRSLASGLPDPRTHHEVVKHVAAFLNSAGGYVLIGAGREGKVLGLLDDDLRTELHYSHRLSETLRQSLGNDAMRFIDVAMVCVTSEDLCLVTCQKSGALVLCCHPPYNKLVDLPARAQLHYDRKNGMTRLLEQMPDAGISSS